MQRCASSSAGSRQLAGIIPGAGGDDELNRDAGHAADRPFVDTCGDVNFALLWPKFLGRTSLPTPKNGKASSETCSTSMRPEGKTHPIRNPFIPTHPPYLLLFQNPLQEGAQGERTGNRPLPAVYPRNATGRMVEGKNVTFTPTFLCV